MPRLQNAQDAQDEIHREDDRQAGMALPQEGLYRKEGEVMATRITPYESLMTEPCVKCTKVNNAHTLWCPVVNLIPGWYERSGKE